MKVAIIGGGTMGQTYAKSIASMKQVEPSGVCDIDPERARRMGELSGAPAYTDVQEMLDVQKPDVACICLPTPLHKEYTLRLAERGIHVICEKPLALEVADMLAMEAACAEAGVRLFVGHVVRFFPNYADAARSVATGKIGKPSMAHLKRFSAFPHGAGDWYRDRRLTGGVVMDLMIHDLDFARSLFGEADTVYARSTGDSCEGMEYAQVTLRFQDGAIASLEAYWGYPGPFTTAFEISGREGIIRFDSRQTSTVKIAGTADKSGGRPKVQVPASPLHQNPYYRELAHFLQCIEQGTEPIVTVHDAKQAVRLALAAEMSIKQDRPVRMEEIL